MTQLPYFDRPYNFCIFPNIVSSARSPALLWSGDLLEGPVAPPLVGGSSPTSPLNLKPNPRERPCVGVVWRSLQVFQKPLQF